MQTGSSYRNPTCSMRRPSPSIPGLAHGFDNQTCYPHPARESLDREKAQPPPWEVITGQFMAILRSRFQGQNDWSRH
ncbi:hypothetical protein JTE90_029653 [Oedothorax gibbosus]|uniref:Uncharacterized protein n=1 Tax=Oedothorax gibbosus TaxID=931172 RepID=A0AAV6VEP5_9ARAC|nr:hypothetical protein JTE90_029653 [Oedothorax gibbosus]